MPINMTPDFRDLLPENFNVEILLKLSRAAFRGLTDAALAQPVVPHPVYAPAAGLVFSAHAAKNAAMPFEVFLGLATAAYMSVDGSPAVIALLPRGEKKSAC